MIVIMHFLACRVSKKEANGKVIAVYLYNLACAVSSYGNRLPKCLD